MEKFPLGIQLFTVREELKTDFKGTIEALAEMGYDGVEMAGNYGGMDPDELAAFLDTLGLLTAGVHGGTQDLLNPASTAYAYADALGARYVTTSRDRDVDKWETVIDEIARAAKVAKARGFVFTYHNHAAEFTKFGGKCALDILFERTDPAEVFCEIDTYWVKKGGEDPVAYIRKYKGRTPQVHLKDMDAADQSFTEIGNGIMDLDAIYEAARFAGATWMIYEQDRWKRPALDAARISIGNLKKAGLA